MAERATHAENPAEHAAPEPLAEKPKARERGRMRRRLRQQRRMREALLLDLGALVFELHRQGRREPELLQAKAAELSAVDGEVRALAEALETRQSVLELVATGVAGSCANCGSLLSTDARYCAACGAPAVPALGAEQGSYEPTGIAQRHEDSAAEQPVYEEPPYEQPAHEEPPTAEPEPATIVAPPPPDPVGQPAPGGAHAEPPPDHEPSPGRAGRLRAMLRRGGRDG